MIAYEAQPKLIEVSPQNLLRDLGHIQHERAAARRAITTARKRLHELDVQRDKLLSSIADATPKQLPFMIDTDPQSARCADCRTRLSIGPQSGRWAKMAFSEGSDARGRTVYLCEPCTKARF